MGGAVNLGSLDKGFRHSPEELVQNHQVEDLRNLGKDDRERGVQDMELLEMAASKVMTLNVTAIQTATTAVTGKAVLVLRSHIGPC